MCWKFPSWLPAGCSSRARGLAHGHAHTQPRPPLVGMSRMGGFAGAELRKWTWGERSNSWHLWRVARGEAADCGARRELETLSSAGGEEGQRRAEAWRAKPGCLWVQGRVMRAGHQAAEMLHRRGPDDHQYPHFLALRAPAGATHFGMLLAATPPRPCLRPPAQD